MLGLGGFAWGFVTRHDAIRREKRDRLDALAREDRARDSDLDRRWLAEKKLIYAKAQTALTAQRNLVIRARNEELGLRSPDERTAALLADLRAGWDALDDARGALDLLAEADVLRAMDTAAAAVSYFETVVATGQTDAAAALRVEASRQCARALNAMREDLGLGPAKVRTAMSDDERLAYDQEHPLMTAAAFSDDDSFGD